MKINNINALPIAFLLSLFFHLVIILPSKISHPSPYENVDRYNIRFLTFDGTDSKQQTRKIATPENPFMKKKASSVVENRDTPSSSDEIITANHYAARDTTSTSVTENTSSTVTPITTASLTGTDTVEHSGSPRESSQIDFENLPSKKLADYLAIIKTTIENNKEYPIFAKNLGLQGTVMVRVSIASDGRIRDVQIFKTSGHRSLDRSAKGAVTTSGPFKPPVEYGLSDVTVDIPITFKLNERG